MPPDSCSRIPSDARAISSALAVFTSAASTSWQAEHTEKCASQCAVSSFASMCRGPAAPRDAAPEFTQLPMFAFALVHGPLPKVLASPLSWNDLPQISCSLALHDSP